MRDYLAMLLHKEPERTPLSVPAAISENVCPTELTKLTQPANSTSKQGSVSFVSSPAYTFSENKRLPEACKVACNPADFEGRKRVARLRSLGVERLPSWVVCREVTSTTAEADLLFAALALADGLPIEHVADLLRRVSPCGTEASARVGEAASRVDVLTPGRVAAYIAAHPFKWELRLNVSDYCSTTEQKECDGEEALAVVLNSTLQ